MSKLFFDPILNKLTKHPTETGVVKSVNDIKPDSAGNVILPLERAGWMEIPTGSNVINFMVNNGPGLYLCSPRSSYTGGLPEDQKFETTRTSYSTYLFITYRLPEMPAYYDPATKEVYGDFWLQMADLTANGYMAMAAWRAVACNEFYLSQSAVSWRQVIDYDGEVYIRKDLRLEGNPMVEDLPADFATLPEFYKNNRIVNKKYVDSKIGDEITNYFSTVNYITSVNGLVPDASGNLILPLGMDGYTEIPEWENVMTYMFEKGPGIYLCKPFATYTGLPEEPGFETKRNNWYINTFITYKRGEAPVVPEPNWGERFAYGDFLLEMNEILPNGYKPLASYRRLAYSNFYIAEHNLPWQKLQGSIEEILIPEEEYPFEYMFLFMYKNGPGRYKYVSSDIPNDIPIVTEFEGILHSLVFDYNTYQSETAMGVSIIQNEFICRLLYNQSVPDFQLWRGVGFGSTNIKWSQILDSNGFPVVEKTNIQITKDMLPTELYDFVKFHFRDGRKEITGELSCQGAEKFLKIENASAGQAVGDGCEKINSFYEFAKLNMGITDKDVICIPLNGMRYEACLDANGYCQLKLHIEKSTTENGILSIAFCNAAFGSTLIYNTLFIPAFGGNPQIAMPILTLETSQMWDIAMAGTAAARKNVVVELSPMSFTTSSLRSTLIAQMNDGETEVEGEITGGTVGGAEPFWNYGEDPVDNVTVSLGYNPNNTLPLILNGAYFKITKNKLGLYSIDIKPTTHHTQAAPYIMGTTYSIMDFKGVINGNNVNAVFVKWDVTSVNFMQYFNAYHKDDPTV